VFLLINCHRERIQRQTELEIEKEERERSRSDREREVLRLQREKRDAEEHFDKQTKLLKQRNTQLEQSLDEATQQKDEAVKSMER
jgi:TATA-binding protein-associated factor Taf7